MGNKKSKSAKRKQETPDPPKMKQKYLSASKIANEVANKLTVKSSLWEKCAIPEISSSGAHNGNLEIKFENYDLMNSWMLDKYLPFQFAYQSSLDQNAMRFQEYYDSNGIAIDNKSDKCWTNVDVEFDKISKWKTSPHYFFTFRIPVHVFNYEMRFKLRLKRKNEFYYSDDIIPYSEWSSILSMVIPSSLLDEQWQSGQLVRFRPFNQFVSDYGLVVEVFINKKDGFTKMMKVSDYRDEEKVIELPIERIMRMGTGRFIDLADRRDTDNRLVVRRRTFKDEHNVTHVVNNAEEIFHLLTTIYTAKARKYNLNADNKKGDSLDEEFYMGQIVSSNVLNFLWSASYDYKISCLLKPLTDGCLNMQPVQRYMYYAFREGLKCGQRMGKNPQNWSYCCDICRCKVSGNDFMFQCSAAMCDRHDFCMICVSNVVKQSEQLQVLLGEILEDELVFDCIKEVVDYVVGRVIVI